LFQQIGNAQSLAQIIVDTVREPLLVLDERFIVLFASPSFLRSFQITAAEVENKELLTMDRGAWDFDELREFLEKDIAKKIVIEGFAISHEFSRIGRRELLLHARKMVEPSSGPVRILLGFEDVTERRATEREKERLQHHTDKLVLQKELLLEEMQHRVLNSLQIIASILMLKARAVSSDETRQHLEEAHQRVMSIAAVQKHLHTATRGDLIEIAPYLSELCRSLGESMIGESRPARLTVVADNATVTSADAVSMGLIVTELVINSLKYAFPAQKDDATVAARYETIGTGWSLSVSDNGVGRAEGAAPPVKGGLGTSLVTALAQQLNAKVDRKSTGHGLRVAIASFAVADLLLA
jgi:chemotaxis protein methyltransferase CheR